MERMRQRKLDNKGFTLVEVMLAVALAGVITILAGSLIVSSSKSYKIETTRAELQNSIQFINTKLQKILMEATTLTMGESNGVSYIVTGVWDDDTKTWVNNSNINGTAKTVLVYEETLYIVETFPFDAAGKAVLDGTEIASVIGGLSASQIETVLDDLEGYQIADVICTDTGKGFRVSLENTIVNKDGSYVIAAPIKVGVNYYVKSNDQESRSSMDVVLRNSDVISSVYGSGTVEVSGVEVDYIGDIKVKR